MTDQNLQVKTDSKLSTAKESRIRMQLFDMDKYNNPEYYKNDKSYNWAKVSTYKRKSK